MTAEAVDIDDAWIEMAAIGGAVLGGGGGGSIEKGIEFGQLAIAYGRPRLIPLDAIPSDGIVVTVSAVGAPAATEKHVEPTDYVRAFTRLRDELGARGKEVSAIMTNEMGGFATMNGLVQSAVAGVPIVDAACNGRAHPTGPMGSMGLGADHRTIQTAVGGDPATDRHLEALIDAPLALAATTIRRCAESAGGLVAVARNPVDAAYVGDHGALGVYEQARRVGDSVAQASDGVAAAHSVAETLDGEVAFTGGVREVSLRTEGGFDVGTVLLDDAELTFWNEYMTLESDGDRLATFPDLITTLDLETGHPLSTADLHEGSDIAVVLAPRSSLSLGAGMRDPALFEAVEDAIGKRVIEPVFG